MAKYTLNLIHFDRPVSNNARHMLAITETSDPEWELRHSKYIRSARHPEYHIELLEHGSMILRWKP
jgi:hypothetical protein